MTTTGKGKGAAGPRGGSGVGGVLLVALIVWSVAAALGPNDRPGTIPNERVAGVREEATEAPTEAMGDQLPMVSSSATLRPGSGSRSPGRAWWTSS